jgi:biotin carboxylase
MMVPPYYDSLIAKLCVWAPDRPRAVARMARALDETQIDGIATTIDLLRDIAGQRDFREGNYTTSYLTDHRGDLPSLGQ